MKINNWKKNVAAFLLFLLVMFIALKDNLDYRKRFKEGVRVESKLSVGLKNIKWKYTADGIGYVGVLSKSHYFYLEDGEQYFVYYDVNDPASSSLSACEPIVDTPLYSEVYCLPLNLICDKGSQLVSFLYMVNGDTIERSHRYKFNSDVNFLNDTFVVYFRKSNPQISYINFE